jgi:carboxypeptidase family protein
MQRRMVLGGIVAVLLALQLSAQTVRGVVSDGGNRPVAGVVMLLVDTTQQVAARALSDARGSFALATPRAGTYQVRTLRIGFRPTTSKPVELRPGGEVTLPIALDAVAIGLDTIHVVDASVCRAFTDSGAATYRVWEQVRAALTATQLSTTSRAFAATTVSYDRTLDKNNGRVLQQRTNVSTEYVTRAWRTSPPDSLQRAGYVVTRRDNTIDYYGPGLDMLLSSLFVDDHCFRLTTDRKQPSLVGLAFDPTPERKKAVADIRGTLWVERASSELRRLEFSYVNVPPQVEGQAGGQLDFIRMRDGLWAIGSWNLRMPVLEQVVVPGHGAELRVASIQMTGGDLALTRRGSDTLWARTPFAIAGMLRDSATGSPLQNARVSLANTTLAATADDRGRFTIAGAQPGDYMLEVRPANADSSAAPFRSAVRLIDSATGIELRVPSTRTAAPSVVPATRSATFAGVVITDSTRAPIAGADVALVDIGRSVIADANGSFRIDSIPPGDHQVRVRAIGYGAADARVAFKPNEIVERRVILGRAITLEGMTVEATRPVLPSFEENRKVGLGHFLTRADLAVREHMSLVSFLETVPSMRVIHGPTGRAWVVSTHASGSIRAIPPDVQDSIAGAKPATCYSQVYLNDSPVFTGRIIEDHGRRGGAHWEPLFDVSTFTAYQVEAVEYYASAAETPLKYQTHDPRCGVLVIWTRKSP